MLQGSTSSRGSSDSREIFTAFFLVLVLNVSVLFWAAILKGAVLISNRVKHPKLEWHTVERIPPPMQLMSQNYYYRPAGRRTQPSVGVTFDLELSIKRTWRRHVTPTDLHQARYEMHVDRVAIPAVGDVFRVALSATLQSDAAALRHRLVARHRHEVDVACNRSTSASNTILFSTTYKVLQSSSPHYLRDIITIQPSRSTRSSSLVTLLHPQAQSSLKITNRSIRYAAPHLWNKLPPSLRVPCQSATSARVLASIARLRLCS